MKENWKVNHVMFFEKANNIYIKNYENNNSVHLKYEDMLGRKKAEDEFDVGRWKVKYYFEI